MNNTEYVWLYKGIQSYRDDWEFIITDGSKSDTYTSFALANKIGVTIAAFVLSSHCSVFTPEAATLLEAVLFPRIIERKSVFAATVNLP